MSTLILVVITALGFAYLATQNTAVTNLQAGNFVWTNVPLYLIALGSLLFGLLLSWIINTVDWIISAFTIKNKETRIKSIEQDNFKLQEKLYNLELENANLRERIRNQLLN